ncbi:MAG: hypothetical protein ACI9T7_000111 [Oleiphilaceae bacterium]|jgi:hypothetical protein
MKNLVIVKDETHGSFNVKDIGSVYEDSSVLAGQTKIQFVNSFDTIEEAKSAYPSAELKHPLLMPINTFDHLPDDEEEF